MLLILLQQVSANQELHLLELNTIMQFSSLAESKFGKNFFDKKKPFTAGLAADLVVGCYLLDGLYRLAEDFSSRALRSSFFSFPVSRQNEGHQTKWLIDWLMLLQQLYSRP